MKYQLVLESSLGVPNSSARGEHRPDLLKAHSGAGPAEQARIVQLLVERVDVREDALEVRIRTEGLASLAAELRPHDERRAA